MAEEKEFKLVGSTYELKTDSVYFEPLWTGQKNFETRRNDRGFQKGDRVILKETTNSGTYRTGREIEATIGYVLTEYQKQGYVTFSLLDAEYYLNGMKVYNDE